jgi:hypothetical protein
MYRNIKSSSIWRIILIGVTLFIGVAPRLLADSAGVKIAKDTLARAESLGQQYSGSKDTNQRDQAIDSLHKKVGEDISHLPQADRVDYAEYMANVLSQARTSGTLSNFSEAAYAFIDAGPSVPEMLDGVSRLLSSADPTVRDVAESLFTPSDTQLPNGEMGQDISAFKLAFQDEKVRKDRLAAVLFRMAPVETAQWLADHANLSADDRAKLEPELQNAWKLHRALNPSADEQTKRILDSSVKNPLLNRWLHSPSWVLRDLANGLLKKREELQGGDLQKAMQPVQVPTSLQVSSTDSQTSSQ